MTRLWSFDLDGVLAEPPFGWNPAINRDVTLQPRVDTEMPPLRPRTTLDRVLTATWYQLRYVLRPPRPGARAALEEAATSGRVIVLTGRHERGRRQTEDWLDRHELANLIDKLVMNDSDLSSPRYKEAYLRDYWPDLHIDDDAATCALLARAGIPATLVSWPRNRGLDYPPNVTRCEDMIEVAALIKELAVGD